MSGPFRELFVEVAIGLLEGAVVKAQEPTPAAKLQVLSFDVLWPFFREAGERFGWAPLQWFRSASDITTILKVRCNKCGRRAFFSFDDEHVLRLMEDTHKPMRWIIDYLWDVLDQPIPCRCPKTCAPGECK